MAAGQCARVGKVNEFDFYVFSSSWAPAYCATDSGKRNTEECGPKAKYGFVVHGLWPQYAEGNWPQCCQAVRLPVRNSAVVDKVSSVMIGKSLHDHEFEKHGSCVTADQDAYFSNILKAVDRVGLAPGVVPGTTTRIKVADLRKAWKAPPDSVTAICNPDKSLSEVRICLAKDLSPIPCPASVRKAENCPSTVSLQ